MKFSVLLTEFQKILTKTLPAIPPKSTIEVLEHLHITLAGNELRIIATDQDITIMSHLEVAGEIDGKILVPARKLNDIIKALQSQGTIEFITNPETYEIDIVTASGRYSMKGLNPEEYLYLPELFESQKPEINFDDPATYIGDSDVNAYFKPGEILRLANKTSFAVSHDEYRPAMTGVLFQFRETFVNAVATDSFRVVRARSTSEKISFPQALDIIVPARSVELLKKVEEEVVMSAIQSHSKITHLRFDFGGTIIITRVIDEKFPPYEVVIPKNNDKTLTFDYKELLAAIKRVSIFTSAISKQIKLVISENSIAIMGTDEEKGFRGSEQISCEFSSENFEVGFNYKLFEELLDNIDDSETEGGLAVMTFSEPNKAALLMPKNGDEELFMVVMPVIL